MTPFPSENMPSKSKAQKKLMDAVAHSEKFSKKVGIPMEVGKDFVAADKAAGKRKLPKRKK
jgi:hypothetical protein